MHPTLTRTLRRLGLLEAGRQLELRLRLRGTRALPDAMIIGALKCGTSSLHDCLAQHPHVIAPLHKEVQYFDSNLGHGERWYRANFGKVGERGLNLEHSPHYLFHPEVPARARALVPDAKLIVLLRNPVRRAYWHYWHERDTRHETLTFEEAIAAEPQRLADGQAKLARGERSAAHQHFSYLARGRYAEQVRRWLQHYPRERLLVLRFEDLAANPTAVLERTLGHLGLPSLGTRIRLEPSNTRRYPAMAPATAEKLKAYFGPYNTELETLLGTPLGW